jgi:hypothetical protein
MKKIRKLTLVFICLGFIFCLNEVFATGSVRDYSVTGANGNVVEFTVPSDLDFDLLKIEMQNLADRHNDAEHITIYDITNVTEKNDASDAYYKENGKTRDHWLIEKVDPVKKHYKSRRVLESDRFMASCAKGETKEIKRAITESLSSSISGDNFIGSFEIGADITCTIEVGHILVGPPEDSRNNTREFRVSFYENRGTWSQKIYLKDGREFTKTGDFTEPDSYESYSIDKRR